MPHVSLIVEALRARPHAVFWLAVLIQATIWVLLPVCSVRELLMVKAPSGFPGKKPPPDWTMSGPAIIPVPAKVPLETVTVLVSVSLPFTISVPPPKTVPPV